MQGESWKAFADLMAAYYDVVMKTSISLAMSCFALCAIAMARADQVTMQNGDVLNGKVLMMTTNSLVLQDENLGSVTLLRAKVASITFGTAAKAAQPAVSAGLHDAPSVPETNSISDLQAALREIREQTNLIQQVQTQILGSASPDAVKKFNDLLDGLSTGRIDMNGLRAQAQSAADQLRSYEKDAGPEASGELEGYLSILDNFLQETAGTTTNSDAP